ncbi:MAG: dephospho-CoA kinase [Endozoicomonas sp.]
MSRPFVIGVTGGIGSGKSAVTDYFASLGIVIVDADQASRVVVQPGRPALTAIAERHGPDIRDQKGALDRRRLREIIFSDESEKLWLEQLLHPLIFRQIEMELSQAESDYVVFVSPLMVETSQNDLIDRLLVVDVPVDLQIQRTMKRDNMTREQTEGIIRQQCSRETRLSKADDVVDNSNSLEQLHRQLDTLHQHYLALAADSA